MRRYAVQCLQKTSEEFLLATRHLKDVYNEGLKNESLIARYMVLQLLNEQRDIHDQVLEVDQSGKPLPCCGIFWSVSHKVVGERIYVAVAIADSPVGIDIECIKPRSVALLQRFMDEEYSLWGGKSWESFYHLWVAKESLIKKLGCTLDDMSTMTMIDSSTMIFKGGVYKVYFDVGDGFVVALA